MARGLERIPLAVDSDFQYQPVRANFPEQSQPEIRLVGFEPDPNPEPDAAPAAPRSVIDDVVGMGKAAYQGVFGTGRMLGAAANTYLNDLSDVELYAEAQKVAAGDSPAAKQEFMAEIERRKAANPDGSVLSKIGDVFGAAANNKMGTAQFVAEQAPNTVVSLGGGWAGAKAGAALGGKAGMVLGGPAGAGIGATVGGIGGFLAGMFLGNTMLETGGKAMEKAEDGFTSDERGEAIREGAIKGGVITGVDAATLGAGGLLAKSLNRAAIQAGARAEAQVLADAGVDLGSRAAVETALASNKALRDSAMLAGQKAASEASTLSRRAAIGGTGLTMETVGEGGGEYLGELAATGKADVHDAALEALAGFTQSGAETAWNMRNSSGNDLDAKGIVKERDSVRRPPAMEGEFVPADNLALADHSMRAGDTFDQLRPGLPPDESMSGDVLGPESLPPGQRLLPSPPIDGDVIADPAKFARPALPAPEDGGPSERQIATARGLLNHSPKASPDLLMRLMRVDSTMAGMLFNHWNTQKNAPISSDTQAVSQRLPMAVTGAQAVMAPSQGEARQPTNNLLIGSGISTQPGVAVSPSQQQGAGDSSLPITPLDVEAHAAATSPLNAMPQPTEAQKAAGNYRKGHLKFQGLDISIENPAGSVRSGKDSGGREWRTEMQHHYGYIKGTVGRDKDHLDVFIKPNAKKAGTAYVVDQIDPKTGRFDEHKVIFGADSAEDARAIYQANYEEGWQGLGEITAMPMADFRAWLKSGKTKKPIAYVEPKQVRSSARRRPASDSLTQAIINRGGISREIMSDVGADPKGRYQPGLFTKNGTEDLSELAELLFIEDGFHQIDQNSDIGPARELEELISRAIRGERILNTEAAEREYQQGLEAEMLAEIERLANEYGVALKDGAKRRSEDDIKADLEAAIAFELEKAGESFAGMRNAALAEGITEDQLDVVETPIADSYDGDNRRDYMILMYRELANAIQEKIDEHQQVLQSENGIRLEEGAGARQDAGVSDAATGIARATGEGREEPFSLESQTEADLAAAEERRRIAEAQRLADEQAAERKAQADAERDTFALTGSDRPADTLAAQGQRGLFDSSPAKSSDAIAGKPVSEITEDQLRTIARGLSPTYGEAAVDKAKTELRRRTAMPIDQKAPASADVSVSGPDMAQWEIDFGIMGKYTYEPVNRAPVPEGGKLIASQIIPKKIKVSNRFSTDYEVPREIHAFRVSVVERSNGARYSQVEYMKQDIRRGDKVVATFEKMPQDAIEAREYSSINNAAVKLFEANKPIADGDMFAEKVGSGEAAGGKSRAVAGGQIADANGYFYKGGQFLPSTDAEPGKWRVGKKWITSGRALVAPDEFAYQPTPFSRSLFELASVGASTVFDRETKKLRVNVGVQFADGSPVTPDAEIRPGIKGVLGKETLTLQEIVDAWNNGQRWFDVQPDAKTVTTQTERAQADQQAEGKIEDFGEKLGGARKDQAAALRDAVTRELTDEEIASQPLSKIWPKESIDQIEDPFIASVAHSARAEIPAKPRQSYKVRAWVEKVKTLRGMTATMLRGGIGRDFMSKYVKEHRGLEHFYTKVQLLESIDRQNWDRIGYAQEWPDSYTYAEDGKTQIPTPLVLVEIDGKRQRYDASSVADVLDKVRDALGEAPQAKKMEFEVRGQPGRYAINKKGDPLYRKLKTFETTKEAFEYRASNYDDLVAAWEAVKDSDNVKESDVRRAENRPRTAEDWRKGKDVTPEQFQDAFGFRGIEFGNWVAQGKNAKERQGMLNKAYDALMDLASIIGVPPKAMSLNGSLGLGFGSRGSGKFAAHFEPDMLVINLTKTRGAGSLAHEWFHALDNYFQSMRGKGYDYITNNPENYYVHKQSGTKLPARSFGKMIEGERDPKYGTISQRYRDRSQWELKEGVRTEVAEAFADMVQALNDSPMAKRASLIDKGKSGGYWSRIIERGARSFENYVIHKMMLKGYHNDYLANVTSIEEFSRDPGRYPYLLEGEIQPVAEAFDNLFATIQTKETDSGVAMFNAKSGSRGNPIDAAALEATIARVISGSPSHFSRDTVVTAPLFADLPAPILAKAKKEGYDSNGRKPNGEKLTGATYDGKVYLVQENISSELEAEETLLHERIHQIVHGNAKDPDGIALRQSLGKLYIRAGAKSGIERMAKEAGIDMTGPLAAFERVAAVNRHAFLAEEFLAHAEGQRAYEKLPAKIRRAAREFWGEFRDWLRSSKFARIAEALGAKLDDFTQSDLAWTLKGIRQQEAGTGSKAIRFMTAWHGSPHDHDGFDSSKIGTGEGAQAYGWGLYFAGARDVAEWYKNKLSSLEVVVDGERLNQVFPATSTPEDAALSYARGRLLDALKYETDLSAENVASKAEKLAVESERDAGISTEADRLAAKAKQWGKLGGVMNDPAAIARESQIAAALRDIASKAKEGRVEVKKGRLYQVELAPEPDEYLDWDKPLSEQAKPDLLRDIAEQEGMPVNYRRKALHEGRTGDDFYKALSAVLGSDEAASKVLNSYGIRGIKYLDGSSRNRPLKDIKAEFLAELPEDADTDEVMELVGTGRFSPKNEALIKALADDDWLGFDYPAQAISAALGSSLSNYDASPALLQAVSDAKDGGTHNYVIFSDADVKITAKESRGTAQGGAASPSVKAIQDVVSRFKSEFKGAAALDIRVVGSASEIPARYRPSPYAEGVFHDDAGLIYLVAGNLRTDDGRVNTSRAFQVLMHEAVGHYGLAAMMGERFSRITARVKEAARAKGEVNDDIYQPGHPDYATVEAVRLRYPDATENEIAQEVLARMAETDPGRTLFGYVRAMIRQWLRDTARTLGIDLNITTAELNDLVALASAYMRRGDNLTEEQAPSGLVAASQKVGAGKTAGGMESRRTVSGNSGRAYTAAQQAAFVNVGREVETPSLKERVAGLWSNIGKKMVQGIADQFAPLKDLDKDAYLLARMSKGADGALEAMLMYGKVFIRDGVYDVDAKDGGVIDKLLRPLGKEADDFLWWVAGNRAADLAKQGRENLMSSADIQALKDLASGTLDFDYTLPNGKTTRDRATAYAAAQKIFAEFNKSVLDIAEQSGLIDGQARAVWESDFYVPFYRDMEGDKPTFPNVKSGLVRQKAFERLKGGDEKLHSDLLANTILNWSHLLHAAAKNRAAKASLEAAERAGAATWIPVSEKGSVSYRDGGDEFHYRVDDPFILDAVTALEFSGFGGPAMKAMGAFKRWLTIGVTASPTFKIRNLIRDSISAIGTAELSYNPIKNLKEGAKATSRDSQTYASMLASGGHIRFGTMIEGNRSDHVRRLVEKGVDPDTILDDPSKLKRVWSRHVMPLIDAWNEIGDRSENINRAAIYEQLRANGMGHAEASLAARDLLDFSMGGTWAAVRFLTAVVPFANARIQGLYKLGRAAKDDPKRLGYVVGAVALASLALLCAYHDDDDWKKREDWDRDTYWWFKIGGVAFRIPKPFEIGAIGTLAERSAELLFDKEMDGERFGKRLGKMVTDTFAMNPVPQMFKPIIDLYANKDSFTGRAIESMGMEKMRPEDRYTMRSSEFSKLVGKANVLSPVQVDHLIRGYFGWLGTAAVTSADSIVRLGEATPRPARELRDMFLIGSFVETLPSGSSRYVTQMYEQSKEIEEAYNSWQKYRKIGDTKKADEIYKASRDDIQKYRRAQQAKRMMTQLNAQSRRIEADRSMSSEEKRNKLRQIAAQKDRIARMVVQ